MKVIQSKNQNKNQTELFISSLTFTMSNANQLIVKLIADYPLLAIQVKNDKIKELEYTI